MRNLSDRAFDYALKRAHSECNVSSFHTALVESIARHLRSGAFVSIEEHCKNFKITGKVLQTMAAYFEQFQTALELLEEE